MQSKYYTIRPNNKESIQTLGSLSNALLGDDKPQEERVGVMVEICESKLTPKGEVLVNEVDHMSLEILVNFMETSTLKRIMEAPNTDSEYSESD